MAQRGRAEAVVAVSADEAYALVTDIEKTPAWSREVYRCRWLGDTKLVPGARFKGWSRIRLLRWWRECEVVVADPPREFSFKTLRRWFVHDQTLWTYRFEAVADGTTLIVEEYEILKKAGLHVRVVDVIVARATDRTPDITNTVGRLKEILESPGADKTVR